jgi:hypothetical protein
LPSHAVTELENKSKEIQTNKTFRENMKITDKTSSLSNAQNNDVEGKTERTLP